VRTQLIESAWSYQHHAAVGVDLKRRQRHADPSTIARSWTAQQRLCGRFRRLAARKTDKKTAVTAIARELAGFVWAEMTAGGSVALTDRKIKAGLSREACCSVSLLVARSIGVRRVPLPG
jgi:hypothetical protein